MGPGARRRRLATAAERFAELPAIDLGDGLTVYEARTWVSRRDGLSGLPELPPQWGLWIAPCRSIHTVGMRFSLDLIWLDGEDQVLDVAHDVAPRRQRTRWAARSVIEVAAGQGDRFAARWQARAATSAGLRPE